MIGYYLDRQNEKPGWRKLTVKVKRDHANVRTRSGFFVTKTAADSAVRRRVARIGGIIHLHRVALPRRQGNGRAVVPLPHGVVAADHLRAIDPQLAPPLLST